MVTPGLTWTDVTVKGRHAGRRSMGDECSQPPRVCLSYTPRELPSTLGTRLFVLCDSNQQGLLPGATLRHRRLRVGG